MQDIYTSGDYLEQTQTWHSEDSPWKAQQILSIMRSNRLQPRTIAEIGCGAGQILHELSVQDGFEDVRFAGYDVSPQAIELCKAVKSDRIEFFCRDLLAEEPSVRYDLLLVIDVIEHVPPYLEFLEKCRGRAEYKVYHIPLDLHVSSVLRNTFISSRYTVGHIHYFSADSALAALRDTGHEIVDFCFTDGALALYRLHPSFRRTLANGPRWLFSKFDTALSARLFGGYSLLALTT